MRKKLMFLLCATALLFACNEQDDPLADIVPEPAAAVVEKGALVSEEEATAVAEAFFRNQAGEGIATKSEAGLLKSPSSIEAIKEEAGNPLMYVMNYPEGGFALVSASRDYYPVLAYSDEGSFELSPDMGPVEVWIEETKEAFRTRETLDAETKTSIRRMWATLETECFQPPKASAITKAPSMYDAFNERTGEIYYQYGPLGFGQVISLGEAANYLTPSEYSYLCNLADSYNSPYEYTIVAIDNSFVRQRVGPLLTTKWHQGIPYNSQCNGYPAGCGPVAMAQIMNFHQFPANISYNGHLVNWSTPEISAPYLIRAAGTACALIYTSIGTPSLPHLVDNAWRNIGYNTTNEPHNANDVKTELLVHERPVMMYGSPTSVFSSHYWVCDGADDEQTTMRYFVEFINPGNYTYSTHSHSSPSYPIVSTALSRTFFHMNWGWGGSNYGYTIGGNNGWFFNNDVNPGNNYHNLRENYYVHP